MIQKLKTEKQLVDSFLQNYLAEQKQIFTKQTLAKEAIDKINKFSISGKTVRGGLFLLSVKTINQRFYQRKQKDLIKIAAALELIHSSLLIHDDIIDQDEKRRGQDSIWYQYQKEALKNKFSDDKNYGQSQAICLGNIANYLANSLLNSIDSLPNKKQKAIKKTIAQEIIKTNFAEMLDSKITAQTELPTIDEVLEMYLYKTARYTFSLPFRLAAIVTDLKDKEQEKIEEISEKLGLIFQLLDDKISLFTDEKISGKSFASDIKEGKKTIFYLELLKKASAKELATIKKYFGKHDLDNKQIKEIQKLFKNHALPEVEKLIKEFNQESQKISKKLKSKKMRELLNQVREFNSKRSN